MYLKQSLSNGKIYLSYVQGYRDENGKVKQKTIKKIGYLDDLKENIKDPIAFYTALAKQKKTEEVTEYTIKNLNAKTIGDDDFDRNLGYLILKFIYEELGIDNLLNQVKSSRRIQYNLNDIFSMLVYMRVIKPGSKKNNYENMKMLFEKYDFSLDDIYRSLSIFTPLKEQIEKVIWQNTKEKYKRDSSKSYYDCTNYYFEIEYNDEDIFEYDKDGNIVLDKNGIPKIAKKGLRKRGPEKNHRPDPIVEMGLLMDATGIPMAFDLFPGNESEKTSLIPIINRTKKEFNTNRTIVVADRGLNCSDNIIKISGISLEQSLKMNGYVYGQSVRGADEEFKNWVLKQDDYINDIIIDGDNEIAFKHKSRIYPKKMYVIRNDKGQTKSGNKKRESIIVDQKQMVYYSQKYANKQKKDREMMILKAKDLINNPHKYTKATSYGAANYVQNLRFLKSTGEIADTSNLLLNEDKIKEEEKYDGYYSIVTSEENLNDIEIRNIYRGLSQIEDTFKITKSDLESRPVWLSLSDHIVSHFLTCFVSLVIIRLIEKSLDNKYSTNKVIETLRSYKSINLEHDIFMQSFRNDVILDLEKVYNVDFSKKFTTLSKIKKNLKIDINLD